jgi:hypothetical protein
VDDKLIGYWSDQPVYQGDMEAADLAFRSDATGWTYWSRDGGGFDVYRFSWHTSGQRQLTLAMEQELSGTWDLHGQTTQYHVESLSACDDQVVLGYQIRDTRDVFKLPARLLELDQPISPGTIGDRFAFRRELAENERDPTTRST